MNEAKYTFSDGTTVTLNPIPPLLLVASQSTSDKPDAPKRSVQMAGGGVQEIARGDDEPVLTQAEIDAIKNPTKKADEQAYRNFRLALAQWSTNSEFRIARLILLVGVKDGPPADQVDLYRAIGWNDHYTIKYAWIASKLTTEESVSAFFERVMGLSVPTQEGLEQAEEMFQSGVARGAGAVEASQPAAEAKA